jgi:hypothetical protein
MPGLSFVQTDDKGTHHQNVVPLYSPQGGAEVPALQKVEFLAELQKSFRRRGFQTYENTSATGLRGQRQKFFVIAFAKKGLGSEWSKIETRATCPYLTSSLASAGGLCGLGDKGPGYAACRQGLRLPQIQNTLYCACQNVNEFIASHGRHNKVTGSAYHRLHIEPDIDEARHHDDLHGLESRKRQLDDVRPGAIRKQRFRKNEVGWIRPLKQRQSLSVVSQPIDLDRAPFQTLLQDALWFRGLVQQER